LTLPYRRISLLAQQKSRMAERYGVSPTNPLISQGNFVPAPALILSDGLRTIAVSGRLLKGAICMNGSQRWRWRRPTPLGSGAKLAFAAGAAALAIFTALELNSGSPAPPVRVARAASRAVHPAITRPKIVIVPRKPVAAAAPSDFDKEQRMSFSQLMGRWNPFIAEAATRFAVPQPWIRAVMQIESGGRTMLGENQPITSSAGAMGLMQIMPSTYRDMRRQYRLGSNPYDPHDNILAGAAYLRQLRAKYPYPTLFAAYNDGPGDLEGRMLRGGLLPAETQNYLGSINRTLGSGIGGPRKGSTKFTRPNGEPVWIDGAAVISVRAVLPDEYPPGVHSVITVGRVHQGVRESLAEARAIIRKHGGGV
jgi:soluble lytic murein transglycosylase-like protein